MTNSPPDTHSAELYERACRVIPGGVSSPVRAFRAVGGTPIFIARGAGAQVFDADGRVYVDFVNSWGPLIAGHAHPAVVAAVTEALARGTTYGAPCAAEVELAERVVACYPAAEQVRFVSSGTEAVMSAIRVARAFTGRDLIVKFAGCYHGHADHLLVAAGSGLATFGRPSSAGVPLDDEQAVAELFAREGDRIAALIIEPVPANHGLLPQRPEFLATLRALTQQHGALLIFDEVITGFRLGRGGAAERLRISPDLATFGKVIGGGMPVGAFGGARRIMARLAPDGDTYQAGTLSGNPVAMTAGLATLDLLERQSGWERLEARSAELERLLKPVLTQARFPVHLVRVGSLLWLSLHAAGAPRTAASLTEAETARFAALFHGMLDRGIYLPPSGYEACFLSLAHGAAELTRFANALQETLGSIA
jgi:glutamate-1-semialdehyde 2,1-aminomutase